MPIALLADIGGTNARFALMERGRIASVAVLAVADHADVESAIAAYLAEHAGGRRPRRAALAAAGPASPGRIKLTNAAWTIDEAAIAGRFGLGAAIVVNDFEALAWALPALPADGLRVVRDGAASASVPRVRAVLGPGTGFGAAAHIVHGGRELVLMGEGGHATLAATNEREAAIVARLRAEIGMVAIEHALSGEGLERLYRAVAAIDRLDAPRRSAAGIVAHALAADCAASKAALDAFCAFLGGTAGDMALTLGADTVFLGGGMVPRFWAYLAASEFGRRFTTKDRMEERLAAVEVAAIVHPFPAFLGLGRLLRRKAGGKGASAGAREGGQSGRGE